MEVINRPVAYHVWRCEFCNRCDFFEIPEILEHLRLLHTRTPEHGGVIPENLHVEGMEIREMERT